MRKNIKTRFFPLIGTVTLDFYYKRINQPDSKLYSIWLPELAANNKEYKDIFLTHFNKSMANNKL